MKRKSLISILLSFMIFSLLNGCDDAALRWTRQFTVDYENPYIDGSGFAVDKAGNSYTCGWTYAPLFPENEDDQPRISAAYILKYDRNGVKQWASFLESENAAVMGKGITLDDAGNCYMIGTTTGDFAGNNLGYLDDGSMPKMQLFLSKYDASGEKQWLVLPGVISSFWDGVAVASDSKGNCYVAGVYPGTSYDPGPDDTREAFLMKFDSNGVKKWTRSIGTMSCYVQVCRIALDSAGSVYIVGMNDTGLDGKPAIGVMDTFIIKCDASGRKKWSRLLGAEGVNTYGTAIAADTAGNCYITGIVDGSIDGQPSSGGDEVFTAKYDTLGKKKWTRLLGTDDSNGCGGNAIAVDGLGNSYVSGGTEGSIDSQELKGWAEALVIKYDTLGNRQWTRLFGAEGAVYARGTGIGLDALGTFYLMGTTNGCLDGVSAPDRLYVYVTTALND